MKNYVSVIVWAIATVLLATAFTFGYYSDLAKTRSIEFRCYLNIDAKDGWYRGNSRPTFTGGELQDLKAGSTIDGFIVSRIDRSSNDFYFDEEDNPTINASKMSCFK